MLSSYRNITQSLLPSLMTGALLLLKTTAAQNLTSSSSTGLEPHGNASPYPWYVAPAIGGGIVLICCCAVILSKCRPQKANRVSESHDERVYQQMQDQEEKDAIEEELNESTESYHTRIASRSVPIDQNNMTMAKLNLLNTVLLIKNANHQGNQSGINTASQEDAIEILNPPQSPARQFGK